jgi:hypothetical protein
LRSFGVEIRQKSFRFDSIFFLALFVILIENGLGVETLQVNPKIDLNFEFLYLSVFRLNFFI